MTKALKLEPINHRNWRSTLQVRTAASQLDFVADYEPVALVILSKSFVRAGNVDWHPLLITVDGDPVGVVAVTHTDRLCEMFHLVIDAGQQGQGLGKASVKLLIEYIRQHWPEVESVALTVHPDNAVAQHIYAACGFRLTGLQKHSEPVMELVL